MKKNNKPIEYYLDAINNTDDITSKLFHYIDASSQFRNEPKVMKIIDEFYKEKIKPIELTDDQFKKIVNEIDDGGYQSPTHMSFEVQYIYRAEAYKRYQELRDFCENPSCVFSYHIPVSARYLTEERLNAKIKAISDHKVKGDEAHFAQYLLDVKAYRESLSSKEEEEKDNKLIC